MEHDPGVTAPNPHASAAMQARPAPLQVGVWSMRRGLRVGLLDSLGLSFVGVNKGEQLTFATDCIKVSYMRPSCLSLRAIERPSNSFFTRRREYSALRDHLKGLAITTVGVLLVVPDSLFVRLINAEPMVTAFWRSLTAGLFILAFLLAVQGLRGCLAVLSTGWPGLIYTVLIATTAPAFVIAVTHTSVANAVFIFASMPIFAAIFSRIFLGEPIQMRMVLTMSAVIFGLAIIAYGSSSSQLASWKGDIWAVYVSAAYAAALTAVRSVKATSMVPAIPFAYIGAAIFIGPFVSPVEAFEIQWSLFLGHGAFIGAASCLLALGPRYIGSTEVSLLILLESVLAPILVWVAIGENPGSWALVGGAVVVGSLLFSNLYLLAKQKSL